MNPTLEDIFFHTILDVIPKVILNPIEVMESSFSILLPFISDRSKGNQGAHISHWHKVEGEAKVLMNENSDEAIDIPYFPLETILAATNNFSNANKLGQGGFGPVYKVKTSFLHLYVLEWPHSPIVMRQNNLAGYLSR